MRVSFSAADHARISTAVAAAEAASDGEVVTIVAPASDRYADVPLQWALLVVFLALAVFATAPGLLLWVHGLLNAGWAHAPTLGEHLSVLMLLLAIKFLAARFLIGWWPLRLAFTPGPTKARRVRRKAIELFRVGAESRTRAKTAVLLYLSLAERRAELVADAAIAAKVAPEVWGDAMAALIAAVKDGRPADGMVAAINQVGAVLAAHFPRSPDDRNELPDRMIEL